MDEIPVRTKEIHQGALFIIQTRGKSGLTHDGVKHRGVLRVSIVTLLLKIKELELPIHALSRSSKPSSRVLSLDEMMILSSALGNLSVFLMQR